MIVSPQDFETFLVDHMGLRLYVAVGHLSPRILDASAIDMIS